MGDGAGVALARGVVVGEERVAGTAVRAGGVADWPVGSAQTCAAGKASPATSARTAAYSLSFKSSLR